MDENKKAFQSACRILGAAAQLTFQLREKLKKKGFSTKAIDFAVKECEKYGYLEDDALIERYVEKEFRRGKGPYLIAAKLREKAGHSCDDTVFAQVTKAREIEKIQELLESGVERKKLYQRGFSSDLLH